MLEINESKTRKAIEETSIAKMILGNFNKIGNLIDKEKRKDSNY
jgi:hypothetical protein